MKSFFIILLMMIKIYFNDGENAASGEMQAITGKYEIIETSNPDLWSKRTFLISSDTVTNEKNTYILTGFTNQGVSVRGVLLYPEITFQRQSVSVIPEGGGGKVQWNIDMDGKGNFGKNSFTLEYKIYQKDSTVISGKISAEKM
ncbi:hypothetical protein QTN47_11315 [Danxiaibacter flavus]|uniref:Uncharacterized protein n=1 Tax=Danxiaibacter flavus TaxID=3049108 RepID=A0ABV3ZE04_9BACT|nr:hypothetical protein QNM32_11320 [Chitinophagaceae bacterium DXS]